MCWEDLQIARKSKVSLGSVKTGAGGSVMACDRNKYRIALAFITDPALLINFMPEQATIVNIGFACGSPNFPALLNIFQHGALVTAKWFAFDGSGGATITIIETVLEVDTYEQFQDLIKRDK